MNYKKLIIARRNSINESIVILDKNTREQIGVLDENVFHSLLKDHDLNKDNPYVMRIMEDNENDDATYLDKLKKLEFELEKFKKNYVESSQELAKCKDELKSLVNYPEQYESLQDELDRVKKHYTLLSNHFGELANHLLGSDWYAANSNDTDGANTEILETIKERYPDVNYSMSRMFKEIKNIIKEYLIKRNILS